MKHGEKYMLYVCY